MERVQLIFAGTRLSTKQTRVFKYYKTGQESHTPVLFKSKLIGYETVGSIITADNEGSTYSNHKYDGSVEEGHWAYDNITQWTIEQRAAIDELKMISEARKEHPESVDEYVKKLQDSTWNMSRKQKAAFALWVFNQLT